VYYLDKIAGALKWGVGNKADAMKLTFLRWSLGVNDSTPMAPLMRETGQLPVSHMWAKQVYGFWWRTMQRPYHDVVRRAMEDSIHLAANGYNCWADSFIKHMQQAIDAELAVRIKLHHARNIDCKELCARLRTVWETAVWAQAHTARNAITVQARGNAVRSADASEGFKYLTYTEWFGHPNMWLDKRALFTFHLQSRQLIVCMARFRLGCSWLNIEQLRYGVHRRERADRVCPCCDWRVVEDELHVLECPAYESLRQRFSDVVSTLDRTRVRDSHMHSMMDKGCLTQEWRRLAQFLYSCQKERLAIVGSVHNVPSLQAGPSGEHQPEVTS
jgi:hypothetical protein